MDQQRRNSLTGLVAIRAEPRTASTGLYLRGVHRHASNRVTVHCCPLGGGRWRPGRRYRSQVAVTYQWRGAFENAELSTLHAEGFGRTPSATDWWERVNQHSLGWVCAREGDGLVGFVNVAWDGGAHAFILDAVVARRVRRRGVGTALVTYAVRESRSTGCRWLHVDFEDYLTTFYLGACGFRPTRAGLVAL